MEEQLKKLISLLSGFGSQKMEDIGIPSFLFLMCISLFCSIFISYLYLYFYSNRATGSQIHRAFPLLGISITAIFVCIQFSLPLSLGLLGALSIVRFRTPIKEPEEIGFIMLVVAVSIACATFNFVFLGVILLIGVTALVILKIGPRPLKEPLNDGLIIISLPPTEYMTKSAEIIDILSKRLRKGRLESITKNGDESVISYNFRDLKGITLLELQSELKDLVGNSNFNIFFNRPGVL